MTTPSDPSTSSQKTDAGKGVMDSRITKLAALLESRNRTLRAEAVGVLAQVPFTNSALLPTLRQYLHNPTWEARCAAAEALGRLLANLPSSSKNDDHSEAFRKATRALEGLDLKELSQRFRPLLGCEEVALSGKSGPVSKRELRKLIDQHLDLSSATGVSSQQFLSDDEIVQGASGSSPSAQTSQSCSSVYGQELSQESELPAETSSPTAEDQAPDDENAATSARLRHFLRLAITDLADHKWQIRHGASLALSKILASAYDRILDDIGPLTLRIVQVLALDRFNDFVTGSNAVAPVRETTAQALVILLLKLQTEQQSELFKAVVGHVKSLLSFKSENLWQCRQTALIVLKYYFAMSDWTDKFQELFDATVETLGDAVDEVVAAAVVALTSLFANSRVDEGVRSRLMSTVMDSVWRLLQDVSGDSQVKDGVDSLLIDLINIVTSWLRIDLNSKLDDAQFAAIINLVDPGTISTAVRVLECICCALDKRSQLGEQELFALLKALYRCILFASPTDSDTLLELAFVALSKLFDAVGADAVAQNVRLRNSVGFWMSCLIYDHKNPEIDVYMHHVDSASASPDSSTQVLCSEEIRFLNEQERDAVLVRRKALAARFLSPLIDVLYRSGIVIGDQPLNLSLQLLFLPYLRSTSLFQRLGAALALNCWARMFRKASMRTDLKVPLEYPTVLVKELEVIVQKPLQMYDEVNVLVNSLTNECNEFRQYCVKKGVPKDALPVADDAHPMEDVIRVAFEECSKKVRKDDESALHGRYTYLVDLIKLTKLDIRTNTNRINALISSTLFYLGYLPAALTPMIRPLVDITESEENTIVVEEACYDAVVILFSATLTRSPCPHAKILKQLCNGVLSGDAFVPKPENWSDPDKQLTILSMDESTNAQGTKSKNCELIVRKLCEQFGKAVFEVIPELKSYLALDSEDLQTLMLNIEMVRIVARGTGTFPSAEEAQKLVRLHLSSTNPAVRFRVARLISELASIDLVHCLNLFFEHIATMIGDIGSDAARAGSVEVVERLSRLEHGLLGACSLLAPLALSAIGDKMETIREAAAAAFRRLVALLPLEDPSKHVLNGFNEALAKCHRESADFMNVLSYPGNLPRVQSSDIPELSAEASLRAYQLEGITWMKFLSKFGLNGILADDMGLGKTLQTLCLLAMKQSEAQKNAAVSHPSLVVCPRTLVDHWCNEFRKYFPNRRPFTKLADCHFRKMDASMTAVASYDELRGGYQKLSDVRWNFVVLDEGHCIRNHTTQLFEAVNSLVSRHRLILSGTPVQNSPADLWSLFRFLMPGYLSTRPNFYAKYMRPILACRNPKATDQQTKEGEEALVQLHRQVLPFILRRVKSDVLSELPEKVIQDHVCELSDLQKALYEAVVDHCSLKATEETTRDHYATLSPLQTLITLRKLVDHPTLIGDVAAKIGAYDKVSEASKDPRKELEASGKMVALREILDECQIGRQSSSEESSLVSDSVYLQLFPPSLRIVR
ncbi:BTF-1 protein [Aphelenchoides avenae]|nr:BTF-1 protein [Aphelenchus avenae]